MAAYGQWWAIRHVLGVLLEFFGANSLISNFLPFERRFKNSTTRRIFRRFVTIQAAFAGSFRRRYPSADLFGRRSK